MAKRTMPPEWYASQAARRKNQTASAKNSAGTAVKNKDGITKVDREKHFSKTKDGHFKFQPPSLKRERTAYHNLPGESFSKFKERVRGKGYSV